MVSEMESSKAHYERRIGELTGAQSDSSDRIQSLQVSVCISTCIATPGLFLIHVHSSL